MAEALQLSKSQAATGPVTIEATRGIGAPVVHELTPDSTIIVGNSPTCGILVDEPGVGPIQCMLALHSDEPELQPWPTASGTLLNGKEVTSRTPLQNGDVIKVGDCVLKVVCGPTTARRDEEFDAGSPAAQDPDPLREPERTPDPEPVLKHPPVDRAEPETPSPAAEDTSYNEPAAEPAHEEDFARHEPAATEPARESLDDPYESPAARASASPYDDPQATRRGFARSEPVFKWDEDAEDDETVAILKAEIVELQTEIAERDAQLEEFLAAEENRGPSPDEDFGDDGSLIARVDELLLELNEGDERLSILETMLSASETANRAEQEERRQLESWVGDIEKRLSENEAVRDAEFGLLRNRLEQVQEERDKAERQLASSAKSNNASQEHEKLLKRLREDNAELQQQLADSDAQRQSLADQLNSVEMRNTQEGQQMVVDQAIREERAKIATQQAELARERAELASKLADIEREAERDGGAEKVDDRVNALREHLKEIHQQEGGRSTSAQDRGGLMSRIAGLWNKLDQQG